MKDVAGLCPFLRRSLTMGEKKAESSCVNELLRKSTTMLAVTHAGSDDPAGLVTLAMVFWLRSIRAEVREEEEQEENQLASNDLMPLFRIEMAALPFVPGITSGAFVTFAIWFLSRIKLALPVTRRDWASNEVNALEEKSKTIGCVPSVPELSNVNGPFLIEVIAFDAKFITKGAHDGQLITEVPKTAAFNTVKLFFERLRVICDPPSIYSIAVFDIDVI